MSGMLRLRDYQIETIAALEDSWSKGQIRVAAVLPTGAGKTVVFSHLSKGFTDRHANKRVLILAHTDELIDQAAKKIRAVAPHLSVGIVKAEKNEVNRTIIVASVQTLARNVRRRDQIRNVGLVIVDECHHAAAASYQNILQHYGALPVHGATTDVMVAGFTATLARGDKKSLKDVWESVAYRRDIAYMIRKRYLVNVRGKRVEVDDLTLDKVKKSGGDFSVGALGEALEASLAPEVVAKAYVEHASNRSGILFAPTVEAANTFADALNDEGVKTEVVHGDLPPTERKEILSRLHDGTTQVVANCMVLTEGFDSPRVSCVVIARPTRSAPLYQQMVGRGLRVDPEKPYDEQDCLILDVVGASNSHGLASLVDLSDKPITPKDGQTLTEAEDEFDEREGADSVQWFKPIHDGPVVVLDFDPVVQASARAWNRTKDGAYFLNTGTTDADVYVFILPSTDPDADPGTYDVAWATHKKGVTYYAPGRPENGRGGEVTEHTGLSLEMARAWGEDVAEDMGGAAFALLVDKQRGWRKTRPSQAQLDLAVRLGVTVPEGASKGEVASLIDAVFASRRVDPIVRWYATHTEKGQKSA